MNVPPLPTLTEVKSAIDKCKATEDWRRHRASGTPEEFLTRMGAALGVLQRSFVLLVRPNVPATPQRYYRLRIAEEPLNDGLISEYGPPPPAAAGYDRCSIAHHPVMYCSANPATTFHETLYNRAEGKAVLHGYLSEWKVREGASVNITPFMFNELPEDSGLKELVKHALEALVCQLSEHYDQDQTSGVIEALKYLSTMFVNDDTRSISSFIAHKHLYANAPARPDIFLYPSTQVGLRRANFAIHPNSIFKLEMAKAFCFEIRGFKSIHEEMTLAWTHERHNHNGVLDRRPITEAKGEQLTKELMADEHG